MVSAGREPTRVGVFGGTFDPPHLGHLIAVTELRYALDLDRVLIVPAGQPPHKTAQPITADRHRLAMLRLAVAGDPALELSTIELDRDGPSYTDELLERLRATLGEATSLIFLMGEDSLRDLSTWHRPNRVAALAELGVAMRPGMRADLETVYQQVPAARGRVHLVAIPLIGIASRDIRQRVATGAPIRHQVPLAVEHYIAAEGLYRPRG